MHFIYLICYQWTSDVSFFFFNYEKCSHDPPYSSSFNALIFPIWVSQIITNCLPVSVAGGKHGRWASSSPLKIFFMGKSPAKCPPTEACVLFWQSRAGGTGTSHKSDHSKGHVWWGGVLVAGTVQKQRVGGIMERTRLCALIMSSVAE